MDISRLVEREVRQRERERRERRKRGRGLGRYAEQVRAGHEERMYECMYVTVLYIRYVCNILYFFMWSKYFL